MLEKTEIFIVIAILLLIFYFVISLSARVSKKSPAYAKISRYLFGIRILISLIAIVSLIFWVLF